MFILKISRGQDLRRIAFATLPSFVTIRGLVTCMFVDVKDDFIVQYVDDEGDVITIKTDLELQEAHNVVQTQTTEPRVMRLFVDGVEEVEDKATLASSDKELNDSRLGEVEVVRNDVYFLNKVRKQIDEVVAAVSKMVNEMELRKHLHNVVEACDNTLSRASNDCRQKYQAIKTIVETSGFSFEQQIQKLKAEIIRLTIDIQSRFQLTASTSENLSASLPYSPVNPVLTHSQIYPSLDEDKNEDEDFELVNKPDLDTSLSPIAALKDLTHLESMGFTDRKKNIEYLTHFKGDMAAVVDALLVGQ